VSEVIDHLVVDGWWLVVGTIEAMVGGAVRFCAVDSIKNFTSAVTCLVLLYFVGSSRPSFLLN
jgi:hypothetical protein